MSDSSSQWNVPAKVTPAFAYSGGGRKRSASLQRHRHGWMFGLRVLFCLCVLVVVGLCSPSVSLAQTDDASAESVVSVGEKLFALQVLPIFQDKCFGCHSPDADELQGGFDLSHRSAMLEGGDAYGDTVIVPGSIDESVILAMVDRSEDGFEMPPKESDKLTQEQVWAIRDWIAADAPWPDDQRVTEIYDAFAEGMTVQTSGGLSDQWTNRKYDPEDLWAFQPIRRDFDEWVTAERGNPIDQIVNRRLGQLGISPAPLADRQTLIRRVCYDLTGLPPSSTQMSVYLSDQRDDATAFAALVDRLLESPHYGEQWARHWLDVARYADSSGFANDWERPNAWRYRDYVIRSFNDDKPFDQFTIEQIAGDELAAASKKPLTDPVNVDRLIGTGFLRMGPWEHTGMSVAKITRQQFLDDVTDSVGQVFLAQPLQCCRCHDHKFDPIPTRDYYSIQAVFGTTQFVEVETPWLPSENLTGMDRDRQYHEQRHQANAELLKGIENEIAQAEARWFSERDLPYRSIREAKKAGLDEDQLPPGPLNTPEQFGIERIGRKWQARFSWEFDRYEPFALSVYNGKTPPATTQTSRFKMPPDPMGRGELEQTAILAGGDPFAPDQPVSPGVLSAVPQAKKYKLPTQPTGRRLAFARWLIDPDHSLTSRVIVNRVWASHFGRGIAGNPNNFGATGKKPTHPELLDHLASSFVSEGWSLKKLHRLILNSDAYKRSTQHPDMRMLGEKDPNNESYAVFLPRRLTAEEIRDAMLMVSGELNPTLGGIPVRPDMNLEAALQPRMIMGTFAPSYVPSPEPADRNRRSIYIHRLRGHRLPFFETFNQPGSEKSCELRDQSNITPQVFTLLNGQETSDRALATAHAVMEETDTDEEAIASVFQRILGRAPSETERKASLDHWRAMTDVQSGITPQPMRYPTEVVREAIDENTGKPFEFKETLFAYRDYKPDLQPHQVDAKTRGLADVCLALLNSNEFVYVY
ncbi:PSD1 and planctomycete cytochrome C domain-containing protein [Stieleria varia]|uniref:Planctomycete cytochrome C n=1 Tax=Stieleria varia TaxID=2528005 RepID=A0A5C6B4P0_9BACT|nr:PSD1 and planctomycete cytochrome C domain-containing protein [Stieleria varia]TWU06256.1 Planctomycete cytochrome C [Stieleria varia]